MDAQNRQQKFQQTGEQMPVVDETAIYPSKAVSQGLNLALLQQLKTVLSEELSLYGEVEAQLLLKKSLIIAGKPNELLEIDQKLLVISQQSMALEAKRQELMEALGQPDQPLRTLVESLPPQVAGPFRILREQLLRHAKQIQELNNNNRKLLDLSLQWIENTMEVITAAVAPEAASYNNRGASKQGKQQGGMLPLNSTVERQA